jgi:hypothetical protein
MTPLLWRPAAIERWRRGVRERSEALAWMADPTARRRRRLAERRRAYKDWRRRMLDTYRIGVHQGVIRPRGSFLAYIRAVEAGGA